ncbi:hypothetical protein GGR92_004235 [Spirosoma lacussanchae]|uniref:hypothetical protein n=1 Tax=Spirosoma lacussanchae TaxID=1884249 RepID=UPI0011087E63|nr:hypothetical protein [Spirosoma lacussanchae]
MDCSTALTEQKRRQAGQPESRKPATLEYQRSVWQVGDWPCKVKKKRQEMYYLVFAPNVG